MRKTARRTVVTGSPRNEKKIDWVEVDDLQLDVDNPRLAMQAGANARPDELVEVLWREMAVDEVALSIAANGFYPSEPLLVIPKQTNGIGKKYVVVEGNRRLAAVLLLRSKELRERIGATGLPAMNAGDLKKLNLLPVIRYSSREELWTTVGFRHINGTKGWDSFSKAKYVYTVHMQYGIPLTDIALKIGDQHSTVLRLYRGYSVLLEAEKDTNFSRSDIYRRKLYFSHLYTALDQREFQAFLGLEHPDDPTSSRVPKSRLGRLEELLLWLYGRKSTNTKPVIQTQAPDLNRLRAVVAKPGAADLLRKRGRLDDAYNAAVGDIQRFREALAEAKAQLETALGTAPTGYGGEPEYLDTARDVAGLAEALLAHVQRKHDAKANRR